MSRELPSAHRASTLLRAKVSATPAARPLPTLTTVEANTTPRTCPGCAPRAMRMPNSFVRCSTENETTLYRPVAASASAKTAKEPNSQATRCSCAHSG